MDINVTTQDNVSIVQPVGYIDTRASVDFEKKMVELLKGGARLFAFDFTRVDMLTSAGIRVLMMTAKRLGGGNRIALWGLNDQIKTVFTIAGLANHLVIVETQKDALAQLAPASPAASPAADVSRLTKLVTRIVGAEAPATRPAASERKSKLVEEVFRAVSRA
jgi:anti-anti-sigma factor